MERCPWAGDEPELSYHDREWGLPLHGDRALFELLTLEGAQAGLSWRTILLKRDAYREAFDGFDIQKVAAYRPAKLARLLQNEGIVRNRLKVHAAVKNAQAVLAVQREGDGEGAFDRLIWSFVGGTPVQNTWTDRRQVPASTAQSDAMSKALKARGFTFVGSTICYAFMQAAGLVNDHLVSCPLHAAVQRRGAERCA